MGGECGVDTALPPLIDPIDVACLLALQLPPRSSSMDHTVYLSI